MAAVAGFAGLSALLAWPTEHLTAAADHWEAIGGRSYGVANQVWRDALTIEWHGDGADALRIATHADVLTTSAVADQLQVAAKVARSGASDLYAARSRLRYAVEDANTAGFDVREDMSVTDRSTGGSPAQRAARHAQAQAFAGDIRQRAAQLVSLDQQVAAKVSAATAGIRDTFPQDPAPDTPGKPKIQAVDNHTFKQDPPQPGPPGNPFAGWTDEQLRQVATEIAHGHALEHFPGTTPSALAGSIYDAMKDPKSSVGTSIKSGGLTLLKADGTVIFINPRDADYGTAFVPKPLPGNTWRTPLEYFEQNTRAVEPLPPPTPGRLPPLTPGEMAPPAPAPQAPSAPRAAAPPPPVEVQQAPPVQPGKGPAFGGGPATPFGPRLEPPPHAGHNHAPVLGDLDPDPWDHGE
jgi:hypothetical protein